MSDAQRPNDVEAEPVDAEFEPAPEAEPKPARARSARRTPWLTIALVTVLAASIGGGSGWLIGRYGPNPERAAMSDRIAALEAGVEASAAGRAAAIEGLDVRLSVVEAEITGAQLRAQGVEQLVRDVASLRTQVAALASAAPEGQSVQPGAGADLEARLDAAIAQLNDQMSQVEASAATALAQAEQAGSSIQQALTLMAQAPPADVQDPERSQPAAAAAPDPAIAAALTQADARLTNLEAAQADIRRQAQRLREIETALAALQDAAAGPANAQVFDRLTALEASVTALQSSAAVNASLNADRAIAFAALNRATSTDEPFPVALADLRRVWPGAPGAAGLGPIARTGAPTVDQLSASFPAAAVRAATGEAHLLFGVIRIERDGAPGSTDAIEAALADEDLAAAVNAARTLDDTAREAAADWLRQAEARLAVDQALSQMSNALSVNAGAGR